MKNLDDLSGMMRSTAMVVVAVGLFLWLATGDFNAKTSVEDALEPEKEGTQKRQETDSTNPPDPKKIPVFLHSQYGNPNVYWVRKNNLRPLQMDETGQYIPGEENCGTPVVYGIEYNDTVKVIDRDYGVLFYPGTWLTKSFWTTERWNQALSFNDMTEGKVFLFDALGLIFLNAVSDVQDSEFYACKRTIAYEMEIPLDSLDAMSGERMKDLLIRFTVAMRQKNSN